VVFRKTLLTGALLLAFAAGAPRAGEAPKGAEVAGIAPGEVDGATARKLVASGVKVVDVRTPEEFSAGHVPGAINIPHDQMASRHGEIGPPTTPVLVYCRSGRRTEIAKQALREKGFSAIYDMRSYDRWTESEPKR
jgi:rhodanese-related sulfurtransferase